MFVKLLSSLLFFQICYLYNRNMETEEPPEDVNQRCMTCTYSKVHITYFTTSISIPLKQCVLKSSHCVQMFLKTTIFQTTCSVKKRKYPNYVNTNTWNKVLLEVLTGTQPVTKFPSFQGSSMTSRKPPSNGP